MAFLISFNGHAFSSFSLNCAPLRGFLPTKAGPIAKLKLSHNFMQHLKNRAGVLYEAIAEYFRSDKARTVSFLNVL